MNKQKGRQYRKPSERAAGFVLSVFDWIKDIIGSTSSTIPLGRAIEHRGKGLPPGKTLHYPVILLVEDNPHTAEEFLAAIKEYYEYGSVMVFIAHAYNAATTFFEKEDVNLVIMDADLDDEDGDGVDLTRKFLEQKPHLLILANSSRGISNLKLTGFGAIDSLGKNPGKLRTWLRQHDPAGSGE